MKLVELNKVTKGYHKGLRVNPVLRNVNLTINQGEFVVLKGENGSGKTTLLNLVLGLAKPDKGTVKLMGLPPREANARLKVGAVLQETQMPRNVKVKELIGFWTNFYPQSLTSEELLKEVNLEDKKDDLATELSGGQKQRLYFALALAGNPQLLVLDEPTRNLDEEGYLEFWQQIKYCYHQRGMTIFMVTNNQADWQELEQLATRVIHLLPMPESKEQAQITEEVLKQIDNANSPQSDSPTKASFLRVLWNQFRFEFLQCWRSFGAIFGIYVTLGVLLLLSWLGLENLQTLANKIPNLAKKKLDLTFLNIDHLSVLLYLLGAFLLLCTIIDFLCKRVAVEKVEGWRKLFKTTPSTPYTYVTSKILIWSLISAIGILIAEVFGFFALNILLDFTTGILVVLAMLLAMLPVALLGLGLGNTINAKNGTVISLVLISIIPLYGTFPLLPGQWSQIFADFVVILPFYHLRQLVLWLTNFNYDQQLWLHFAWLVWGCVAFGLFAVKSYEEEN